MSHVNTDWIIIFLSLCITIILRFLPEESHVFILHHSDWRSTQEMIVGTSISQFVSVTWHLECAEGSWSPREERYG